MRDRVAGFGDQCASAASNLLVSLLAAHDAAPTQYGRFALAILVYNVSINLVRSYWFEPMLIRSGRGESGNDLYHFVAREVTGFGIVAGAAVATVGMVVSQPVLWIIGAALPILYLQDFLRFSFFRITCPAKAFALDGVWLTFVIVLAPVGIHYRVDTDMWMLIWITGATLSVLWHSHSVVMYALGPDRRIRGRGGMRRVGAAISLDNLAADGVLQFATFLVPIVSSVAALGTLRLSQVAAGPVNTVMSALSLLTLPIVAQHLQVGRLQAVRKLMVELSIIGIVFGLSAAAAFALLPTDLGHFLFGGAWNAARGPAIIISVASAIASITRAATILLRASGNAGSSALMRALTAPVAIASITIGAHVDGALGAAYGFLIFAVTIALGYAALTARVLPTLRSAQDEQSTDVP